MGQKDQDQDQNKGQGQGQDQDQGSWPSQDSVWDNTEDALARTKKALRWF